MVQPKTEPRLTVFVGLGKQQIAWQSLLPDKLAQLEGETLERAAAAGLFVQVPERKGPAFGLSARVFADNPVQPTLDPCRILVKTVVAFSRSRAARKR